MDNILRSPSLSSDVGAYSTPMDAPRGRLSANLITSSLSREDWVGSEVDSTVENRGACRVDTTAGGANARHVVEREMLARDDAASSSRERRDSMVYSYWFYCYFVVL